MDSQGTPPFQVTYQGPSPSPSRVPSQAMNPTWVQGVHGTPGYTQGTPPAVSRRASWDPQRVSFGQGQGQGQEAGGYWDRGALFSREGMQFFDGRSCYGGRAWNAGRPRSPYCYNLQNSNSIASAGLAPEAVMAPWEPSGVPGGVQGARGMWGQQQQQQQSNPIRSIVSQAQNVQLVVDPWSAGVWCASEGALRLLNLDPDSPFSLCDALQGLSLPLWLQLVAPLATGAELVATFHASIQTLPAQPHPAASSAHDPYQPGGVPGAHGEPLVHREGTRGAEELSEGHPGHGQLAPDWPARTVRIGGEAHRQTQALGGAYREPTLPEAALGRQELASRLGSSESQARHQGESSTQAGGNSGAASLAADSAGIPDRSGASPGDEAPDWLDPGLNDSRAAGAGSQGQPPVYHSSYSEGMPQAPWDAHATPNSEDSGAAFGGGRDEQGAGRGQLLSMQWSVQFFELEGHRELVATAQPAAPHPHWEGAGTPKGMPRAFLSRTASPPSGQGPGRAGAPSFTPVRTSPGIPSPQHQEEVFFLQQQQRQHQQQEQQRGQYQQQPEQLRTRRSALSSYSPQGSAQGLSSPVGPSPGPVIGRTWSSAPLSQQGGVAVASLAEGRTGHPGHTSGAPLYRCAGDDGRRGSSGVVGAHEGGGGRGAAVGAGSGAANASGSAASSLSAGASPLRPVHRRSASMRLESLDSDARHLGQAGGAPLPPRKGQESSGRGTGGGVTGGRGSSQGRGGRGGAGGREVAGRGSVGERATGAGPAAGVELGVRGGAGAEAGGASPGPASERRRDSTVDAAGPGPYPALSPGLSPALSLSHSGSGGEEGGSEGEARERRGSGSGSRPHEPKGFPSSVSLGGSVPKQGGERGRGKGLPVASLL